MCWQRYALRAECVEAINLYHDLASAVRDDRPGLDGCFDFWALVIGLVGWPSSRSIHKI